MASWLLSNDFVGVFQRLTLMFYDKWKLFNRVLEFVEPAKISDKFHGIDFDIQANTNKSLLWKKTTQTLYI